MTVKILEEQTTLALQDSVNRLLLTLSASDIFDIKYSTYCFKSGYFPEIYYTAMIILKRGETQ